MSYPILRASSLFVGICLYLLLYCHRALKYLQPWCFLVKIRGFGLRAKKYFIVPIIVEVEIYKSQNTMKLKYMSYALPSSSQRLLPCIPVETANANASRNKQVIILSFSFICKYQRNNYEIKSPHKVKCTIIMEKNNLDIAYR